MPQPSLPFITIAIPAYKTEFLPEAIRSALMQTYSDFEVLVVDDCLPGGVREVVDKFDDVRIRYYRNEKNVGKDDPSRNWMRCLDLARGEYICILCDDDMYGPDFLQTLVTLVNKYPSCSAFRCGVSEIDERGETRGYYSLAPEFENVEEYMWHYFSRNNHQTISEWMLKTSSLESIGGYVACPMAWGSDCSTVYLLAEKGGVVTSPVRQVFFRYSSINITGQKFKFVQRKVLGWIRQCDTAKTILDRSCHSDKDMIVGVVEHERKRELRKLFKHASACELCSMVKDYKQYNLSIPVFIMMMLRNPLWHIIAKRKK